LPRFQILNEKAKIKMRNENRSSLRFDNIFLGFIMDTIYHTY
jgi:hypothetical protein